MAPPLTEVRDI